MAKKKSTPRNGRPKTIKISEAKKAKLVSQNVAHLAEFAAKALIAAEKLGIKKKPLEHFWLAPAQRELLLTVPEISKPIRTKLAQDKKSFTIVEVASMATALAETSTELGSRKNIAVLLVAKHLADRLQEGITHVGEAMLREEEGPTIKADPNTVYQFKITLLGSKPPIWRRIQVKDCTLDKFHEHIQTAMGWTNSHLHQFHIAGKRYGNPQHLDDGFGDVECVNSKKIKLSQFVPSDRKKFKFRYEYDFGDGWEHDVLFEGSPKKESRQRYPLCLEGERACPPEDVGGIGGFYEYVEALADPKHERHEELLEWAGPFDPDSFDAGEATQMMRDGLPDWGE